VCTVVLPADPGAPEPDAFAPITERRPEPESGPKQPTFAPPPGVAPTAAIVTKPAPMPVGAVKPPPISVRRVVYLTLFGIAVVLALIVGALKLTESSDTATRAKGARTPRRTTTVPATTTAPRPRPTVPAVPRVPVVDAGTGLRWTMRAAPTTDHQSFTAPGGASVDFTRHLVNHGDWAEAVMVAPAPGFDVEAALAAQGVGMKCQVGPAMPTVIQGHPGVRAPLSGCFQAVDGTLAYFEANGTSIAAVTLTAPGSLGEAVSVLVGTIVVP
jgi:hypothetical protein